MTRTQTTKAIAIELNSLNTIIDQKIIKGLAYSREAARHKALLNQLSRLNQISWFSRAMTSFLL